MASGGLGWRLTSSSSSVCFTSRTDCVVEKNSLLKQMLPTRIASRSWKHMLSFRSFVVSQPSV